MSNPRKPIFEAVRDARPDVWNDPGNIHAMDNLLDALGIDRPDPADESLTASPAGIDLIHTFEGYARELPDGSVEAYPDPATGGKPWTIGFGSTTDENGRPITPGTVWSRERAEARFAQHLAQFEQALNEALDRAPTSQNQFDAMLSLMYNVGAANFRGSTLLRKHKVGDYGGAQAEFARWSRAAGRIMKGLVRRRAAEAALYGKP